MKYPYIGELTQNDTFCSVALFAGKDFGAPLKRTENEFDLYEFEDDYNESDFKNITREYLTNTYGKVESKEHAEFIKLLAEVNGMPCGVVSIDMNYKIFYVIDRCLFFCVENINAVGDYREVTIPLPPKQDDSDEWPKVGSEVTWGYASKGEVKSISDGFAWVKKDGGDYYTVRISSLKKPKTPEEELREDLSKQLASLTNGALSAEGSWIKSIAEGIISNKLNGFNITKKPQ